MTLKETFIRRVVVVTLLSCLLPYIGLQLYLRFGMHGASSGASVPSPAFFAALGAAGIVLPCVGVTLLLRRLIANEGHFKLRLLLETYVALILLFASSFAILQRACAEAAISGVPIVWQPGGADSLPQHLERLHAVYFDSLYLSTITITTVGYGDMVPLSPWAKFLSAVEGLVGVGFGGVALGHYFRSDSCRHFGGSRPG